MTTGLVWQLSGNRLAFVWQLSGNSGKALPAAANSPLWTVDCLWHRFCERGGKGTVASGSARIALPDIHSPFPSTQPTNSEKYNKK